ncbi:MAG: hypothetical protein ACTHJW_19895 [Streptosporangiaceae bacterium]
MTACTLVVRWAIRAGTAAVTAVIAAAGLTGTAGAQVAAHRASGATPPPAANPFSPAAEHSYRHGVLPTPGRQQRMNQWSTRHAVSPAASSLNLSYGGGVHGVGVTTGHEKVYLVFWGSQWGASATDSHGDVTLANDPSGAAPYLQELFKGLGTGKERWSGVMTQYCDGVPNNSHSCPPNSSHVAYPGGGAMAGVWVDKSTAAPDSATGNQLGSEAVKAAKHFGNTTQASNRDTQYAILSPTGTHPDGFGTTGEFCAWHDDSADPNLPGGPVNSKLDVAFTNMPYVTDLGASCGENFVNGGSQGIVDGFSIVLGHEYSETITDQLPAFGWTNTLTGEENADLCAWNPPGTAGGTNDLTLTTGTFAMQSTWANDNSGGGCAFTHRLVTNNWVLNGGFEAGTFAHWTRTGAATAIVKSGTHSGKDAARLGKSAPTSGNSSIAQTFTARGTHLTFWYKPSCPDTVDQSWATATLTDNTAHSSVTVLAKTCTPHGGWHQVIRTVIAGHSYTLKVTSHDDNDVAHGDGNLTLVDDVVNK